MKLSPFLNDLIRKNVEAFLKQNNNDSLTLMPMLPKQLLLMCDTIDELYQQLEKKNIAFEQEKENNIGLGKERSDV